jgi:hypothetical protein
LARLTPPAGIADALHRLELSAMSQRYPGTFRLNVTFSVQSTL